jgi:hypothetical protein
MNRKSFSIITGVIVLAMVSMACGISLPGSSTIDSAATSVAGTVSALAATAGVVLTPEAHTLPTSALPTVPPPAPVAPLKVSFVSPDRNLYVWDESMVAPVQLTVSGDVEQSFISSDGTLIAFTRTADYISYSLELINFDNSNLHTVVGPADFAAYPRPSGAIASIPTQIEWIPNTHSLVFNCRFAFEGPGLSFSPSLYKLDADTGLVSTVLSAADSWKFFYSPDGSKIAISIPTGIGVYNADGSVLAGSVLVYPFVNTASEYAWVAYPKWSADSTTLVAVVPPTEPWGDAPGDSTVWRMAANGSSGEQTLSTQMAFLPFGSTNISPDLSTIVYFTRLGVPTDNNYTMHISNIDGSSNVEYTTGKFNHPVTWSPDSSRFVYSVGDGPATSTYIGQAGVLPVLVPDITNADAITWLDSNRYLASTNTSASASLLLGTLGSPTGMVYSGSGSAFLNYSVNR